MKRIASLLSAITIATAAGSAMADFPSSADETTSFTSIFPHVTTYADLHKNDVVKQASSPFPSSANETTSLSSTFPQMTTYADLHKDNVKRASSGNAPSSM
jgi:hypothetical protein